MNDILILMGRYLPGYKDGGPVRTMINVTEALGDEYNFYIACMDRDHGDLVPYPGIKQNAWNRVGKANVWYVSPGGFTESLILKLAKGMDCIYLSSFYDDYGYRTLWMKRLGRIKQPVYLASMGVFSEGALQQKRLKKKMFITACKILGLFRNITWSVTSEMEAEDVKRNIGAKIRYIVAEDLPRNLVPGWKGIQHNLLKVVFLSRISPKKNLLRAIESLQRLQSEVVFTIYGPIEDVSYWNKCQEEIKRLPSHVVCHYEGNVPTENVQEKLSEHDVFLFPTLGENYGHVIFEALSVGCIPVISDQTPWNEIAERNAGYVLPLSGDFGAVVERLARLEDRSSLSRNAVQLALDKVEKNLKETGYRQIFG